MGILFLKIVLTLFVVLGITWATERFGGRVGAILSGFPNTMAVILLFYGLENGGEFVAKTIPFGLAGLSAVLVFSATWAYSTNIIDLPIINSFFAITIFAFAVYILQFFSFSIVSGFIIAVCSILFFGYILHSQDVRPIQRKKVDAKEMIFRIVFILSVVLLITGFAKYWGVAISGFFSAFPVNLFPVLFILHRRYGKNAITTLLSHWPLKLFSIVGFLVSLALLVPFFPFVSAWGISLLLSIFITSVIVFLRI